MSETDEERAIRERIDAAVRAEREAMVAYMSAGILSLSSDPETWASEYGRGALGALRLLRDDFVNGADIKHRKENP